MSEYNTKPTIDTLLETVKQGFAEVNSTLFDLQQVVNALRHDMAQGFTSVASALTKLDRRVANQDAKLDAFIEDVIEMKRNMTTT